MPNDIHIHDTTDELVELTDDKYVSNTWTESDTIVSLSIDDVLEDVDLIDL